MSSVPPPFDFLENCGKNLFALLLGSGWDTEPLIHMFTLLKKETKGTILYHTIISQKRISSNFIDRKSAADWEAVTFTGVREAVARIKANLYEKLLPVSRFTALQSSKEGLLAFMKYKEFAHKVCEGKESVAIVYIRGQTVLFRAS